MSNNNHKNPNCAYAENLIAYLYDETSVAEKAEFETHLENCPVCDGELAEFSFARTAIRDWRGAEFDRLATPIFVVPTNEIKFSTITENPRSWFGGWRQIFAFKPALAMSAFALLIALFGVILLSFNFNGNKSNDEIAVSNAVKTAVSPTIDKSVEQPKQIVVDNSVKSAAPDVSVKVVDKKSVAPKPLPVRATANTPKNISPEIVPVRAVQNTSKGSQKSTGAPKSNVPRLTDAEEEEDNSVRLADLFDEIGTR